MTYDNGRFVWFELVAKDKVKAQEFYAEVVGWKVQTMEMAGGVKYPMAMAQDATVGGFADPQRPGEPAHWISYVSVADVDRAAKAVDRHGGRRLGDAFDIPTVGRMQPVADPHGAVFFLYRGESGDAPAVEGPGAFHWNELLSDDPEAAVAFYEKAFGYSHETMNMGGGTYFVLKSGDALRGGVVKPEGGLRSGRWLQYVTVEDCDQALARTKKSGGRIVQPATDVPGVGRVAVVDDVVGAQIGLIKPAAG